MVHLLEGILFLYSILGLCQSGGGTAVSVRTPTGELCSHTPTESLSPYPLLYYQLHQLFQDMLSSLSSGDTYVLCCNTMGPWCSIHPKGPLQLLILAYTGANPSASIHLNRRSVSGSAATQTLGSESCKRGRSDVNKLRIPDHHCIITMTIINYIVVCPIVC